MIVTVFLKSIRKGFDATATFDTLTKQVVVLKGSKVSENISNGKTFGSANSIKKLRINSVENQIVIKEMKFNSPSTAANFVTGSSTNGWLAWKDLNGKSIKATYSEEFHE